MEKVYASCIELTGTNYEIGYFLGKKIASNRQIVGMQSCPEEVFNKQQLIDMTTLFDVWCPGLNEELHGFSDALGIAKDRLIYCYMTYLVANCSQIAVLPSMSDNNHVYLARNTDFSHQFEDFTLCKTKVIGKYAHIGTSIVQFGRGEGINECGLAISQTSCGIPVGSGIAGLKEPVITGLQYWAVIRTLLENCKDIESSLALLKEMPIAYNINLMLADKTGKVVLFETLDGKKSYQQIDSTSKQPFLHSTNHAVLPELYTPSIMKHSAVRYDAISSYMNNRKKVTLENLKNLLLKPYPSGVYCPWYHEFLGTTKSIVFDVSTCTIHICWGGLEENGWNEYTFQGEFPTKTMGVSILPETPTPDVFTYLERTL